MSATTLLAVVVAPAVHVANNGVFANVYTVQHQAGCPPASRKTRRCPKPRNGTPTTSSTNTPSTGTSDPTVTPQSCSAAAGFSGTANQTVAFNPALAINNLDAINQWYYDPAAFVTMSNCANSANGAWSMNGLDRSALVAVYGQPA